jgi:hypothetical protein
MAWISFNLWRAGEDLRGDQQRKGTRRDILVTLRRDESDQGLIECLLVIARVAFAGTAGMTSVATSINSAFARAFH